MTQAQLSLYRQPHQQALIQMLRTDTNRRVEIDIIRNTKIYTKMEELKLLLQGTPDIHLRDW